MNRAILSFLALVLVSMAWAQGPPAKVSSFTVEKSTRFSEFPTPMQSLDPGKYSSDAGSASGMVELYFTSPKVGKFKKGSLSVNVRNKVVISVSLAASSKKAVQRLLEEMKDQFGDPYKLQSHNRRYFITWLADRDAPYKIEFESEEDFTDATVTIVKR